MEYFCCHWNKPVRSLTAIGPIGMPKLIIAWSISSGLAPSSRRKSAYKYNKYSAIVKFDNNQGHILT